MRLEEYTESVSEASTNGSFRLRLAFKTVARLSSFIQKRTAAHTEAAGLLFGAAEPGLIHVAAFRSFALELPYNAKLPLQQFREAANAALAASRFDPEVASLQPIGWYRLHLEPCSEMSNEEVQLHNAIATDSAFTALLLQPSLAGVLSGLVFSGSVDGNPFSSANQRRGSLNISTTSSGVESVEVTVRDAAQPSNSSAQTWSRIGILRTVARHGAAFKKSLSGYAWGLALVASLFGFLVGATLSQDGQFSSVSTPKTRGTPVSTLSKNSPFDLAMIRDGTSVIITWNNGLPKPTLAYLTITERGGVRNLNITSSYRPNGVLLLPGHGGPVEASLALSDGLDTIERRASLQADEKSFAALATPREASAPTRIASERTSEEVSRLETRNRRLEALITVLEQRKEDKTHVGGDETSGKQPLVGVPR